MGVTPPTVFFFFFFFFLLCGEWKAKATGREKCVEAEEEEEEEKKMSGSSWSCSCRFTLIRSSHIFFSFSLVLSFLTAVGCSFLFPTPPFSIPCVYPLAGRHLLDSCSVQFWWNGTATAGDDLVLKNIHPSSCLPVRFTLLYTVHCTHKEY